MLARQRQEAILREVDRIGGARVSDLVDILGVSDMTVHRDIEALAAGGLVLKVHGGATAVVGRPTPWPVRSRPSCLTAKRTTDPGRSRAHD